MSGFDRNGWRPVQDGDPLETPLWQRRLNTWSGRVPGDDAPVTFTHWTRHGTISLRPIYPAQILHCGVFLDDQYITTMDEPLAAAKAIGAGEADRALGFDAREAGVGDHLSKWTAHTT